MFHPAKHLITVVSTVLSVGILTTGAEAQTEPTTRADILPGVDLVVEAVEPGVYRVEGDGIRSLRSGLPQPDFGRLIFGLDGSVWLGESAGASRPQMVRLGQDEPLRHWAFAGLGQGDPDIQANFQVAGDGTAWLAAWDRNRERSVLFSNDGTGWQRHPKLSRFGLDIRTSRSGEVWATLDEGPLWRWHGERWKRMPASPAPAGHKNSRIKSWYVGDDGVGWAHNRKELQRFDGRRWRTVARTGDRDIELTPSGEAFAIDDDHRASRLLDDGSWSAPIPAEADWTVGDFDPGSALGDVAQRNVSAIAADGGLWRSSNVIQRCDGHACNILWELFPETDVGAVGACGGIERHVGAGASIHLAGQCVWDVDFDTHGNVWVEASAPTITRTLRATTGQDMDELAFGPTEIFVITSEAMALAR